MTSKKSKTAKGSTKRKAAGKAAKSSKSAGKSKAAANMTTRGAMSIAANTRKSVDERVAALSEAPGAVCESDKNLQTMLTLVLNQDEPATVRLAALRALQAASFSAIAFESCRPDYIAALRKLVDDPHLELRQRALGILAREKDGYAQKKLLEGLQKPDKALLPPEKALQLLSNDVHAEAYSAAREIVKDPPSDTARREALRLLAADATAAPMFEKILRDKDELAEIRQISASALQSLKPEKLQEHAREIVLDPSEYDEIQATSLTALAQFGDEEAIAKDEALLKSVSRISDKASAKSKQNARRFLSKYSG